MVRYMGADSPLEQLRRELAEKEGVEVRGEPRKRERGEEDLDYRDRAQDIDLKKQYAMWAAVFVTVQIVCVNVFMFLYAEWGVHWKVPAAVIEFWLGGTVVQLVGVALVVARYLFPRRDSN